MVTPLQLRRRAGKHSTPFLIRGHFLAFHMAGYFSQHWAQIKTQVGIQLNSTNVCSLAMCFLIEVIAL